MTVDLDRWRQIALRDPTGYQSSGVPGSGLTIPFWTLPDLLKVIAEAVAEETKRCVEACKRIQRDRAWILHSRGKTDLGDQAFDTAMACIDAIRQTERSMIPAPFPVIVDKEGNVLACVPINLKEPPK